MDISKARECIKCIREFIIQDIKRFLIETLKDEKLSSDVEKERNGLLGQLVILNELSINSLEKEIDKCSQNKTNSNGAPVIPASASVIRETLHEHTDEDSLGNPTVPPPIPSHELPSPKKDKKKGGSTFSLSRIKNSFNSNDALDEAGKDPAPPSVTFENPLCQGYLEQVGEKFLFGSKSAKKRYCVLDKNLFYIFEESDLVKKKKKVDIEDCCVHNESADGKKFEFDLQKDNKVVLKFDCGSKEELDKWVKALTISTSNHWDKIGGENTIESTTSSSQGESGSGTIGSSTMILTQMPVGVDVEEELYDDLNMNQGFEIDPVNRSSIIEPTNSDDEYDVALPGTEEAAPPALPNRKIPQPIIKQNQTFIISQEDALKAKPPDEEYDDIVVPESREPPRPATSTKRDTSGTSSLIEPTNSDEEHDVALPGSAEGAAPNAPPALPDRNISQPIMKQNPTFIISQDEALNAKPPDEDYDDIVVPASIEPKRGPSPKLQRPANPPKGDQNMRGTSPVTLANGLPPIPKSQPPSCRTPNQEHHHFITESNIEKLYIGKWDFSANIHKDQLSFKRGEIVEIIGRDYDSDGWWVGKNESNKIGIVPKEYLLKGFKRVGESCF